MTLTLVAALLLPAQDPAKPTPEVEKAQKVLAEYLKGIPGAAAGRVTPLTADGLPETLPDHVLFAVNFPQFPVARVAPEPLKSSNVVAVPKKDGKPVPVTDTKELQAFFKANARDVKTAAEAGAAVRAWLRAAAELNQDGFYRFTVKDKVDGDAAAAAGEVTVDPAGGNKGGITARLTFKDGKLAAADTKVNLVPG
ncbi:MAG: hypothetical protein C0501_26770, partial [Isosphaera sp.]|nr:hypothetical protein [Isosphaera sp.]